MDDNQSLTNTAGAQPKKKFTFFGSYDHSIDAKGRIIVPTAYRKALGDSFTITIALDDKAIARNEC